MPLLQKITRSTVRILGTVYSSRIVGLHNRVRAHASRLLVYKDLSLLPGPRPELTRGLFVPGRRRLVIYLKRGATEITVAHELIHALLYGEAFLPLRCRSDDLVRNPGIGLLASRLNDLLVHPVVFERLRRCGYPISGRGTIDGGAEQVAPVHRFGRPWEGSTGSRPLGALAMAVAAAETIHRAPGSPATALVGSLERRTRGLGELAKRIARLAPWNRERSPLDGRLRAARIVQELERGTREIWGKEEDLPGRILMPAVLTKRRLAAPARALFDARTARAGAPGVVIGFLPDGAACSARAFADASRAERVAEAVRGEMAGMSAERFIARHRLEYLFVEGGRRHAARRGGDSHDAEALFAQAGRHRRERMRREAVRRPDAILRRP